MTQLTLDLSWWLVTIAITLVAPAVAALPVVVEDLVSPVTASDHPGWAIIPLLAYTYGLGIMLFSGIVFAVVAITTSSMPGIVAFNFGAAALIVLGWLIAIKNAVGSILVVTGHLDAPRHP